MNPKLVLVLIVLAFVLIYARTSGYDYVWDDVAQIAENPIYEGPVIDGLLATQHDHIDSSLRHLTGLEPAHDSYRPLLFLSHRFDVALFGVDAGAQHLVNVLLGVLAILIFHAVAASWLASPAAALTATAVFALHPLQVEPVAYVSARGDLLAGLFALVAIWCVLLIAQPRSSSAKGSVSVGWTIGAALAFLASLLCKEAYVGLPFALAGVLAARGQLRSSPAVLGTLLAVLIAYLVFRVSMAGAATGVSASEAFLALPGIWLNYLRIALAPFDLSTERLYDARYWIPGWIAVACCAAATSLAWRRPSWQPARTPLSGLFWMLALLGPSSFIVLLSGVVADRYAYLPLAGFAVCMAWLIHQAPLRRPLRLLVRTLFGITAGMWLITTVLQVSVWKDNRSLYTHAVASSPRSSMAHYRLGYEFARQAEWKTAVPLLERAVELDPSNHRALNNLGVCYMNMDRLPDAERAFAEALAQTGQTHYRAWYNLGVVHMRMGHKDEACEDLDRALAINPSYEQASQLRDDNCERSRDAR